MLKGSNFTKKIFLRKIFVHLFSLVLILVSIETGRECIAQNQAREENFVFSEKGTSTGVVLDSSGWKNIVEENHSDSWMKAGQEAESRADGTFSENIPADNFSSRETVDGNLLSGSRESASQGFSENFGSADLNSSVGASSYAKSVSYCELGESSVSAPCVVAYDQENLGYPWNKGNSLGNAEYCVRGQGEAFPQGEVNFGGSVSHGLAEGQGWADGNFSLSGENNTGENLVPGSVKITDHAVIAEGAGFTGSAYGSIGDRHGEYSEGFESDPFLNGSSGRLVGNGRAIGGGEVLYSPEEERYHYWDPRFKSCLPGFGRELPTSNEPWSWQMLPGGTLYRAHFASNREGRLGIHFINEDTTGLAYWDPTLGGRINLIRYGTRSRLYPEGIQWDVECGAIARLTLMGDRDLHGTDYRIAFPLTFRKGRWEFKFGYYHISSHMGDEWIVKHYEATGEVYRINYVRDCLMWGIAFRPDANWRFYVGGDYVFWRDCGAKPWQFELGAEYSPMMLPNFQGSPFLALHFRWSEDTDFETYSALEAGWQWKTVYQQTMRTGLYAMAGYADQYQFFNRWEKQIGFGFWFDF